LRSADRLKKHAPHAPQWCASTSGPIWSRLYSTVFWVFVERNGTTETNCIVFPWYIYRSECLSLEEMRKRCVFLPLCANSTTECLLLRSMARCWIELISQAERVIAWSQKAVDILNQLNWFVLNDVFQVTPEDCHKVLLRLGWQQKPQGYIVDMTYISKHPTRYVDLSAAFAEGKPKPKLDYAARKWLSRPASPSRPRPSRAASST
jgi:hypothetical protein